LEQGEGRPSPKGENTKNVNLGRIDTGKVVKSREGQGSWKGRRTHETKRKNYTKFKQPNVNLTPISQERS